MGNLNYSKGTGEWKNWLIEETCFDSRYLGKCEAIFCQGNGYMGVRAALEESYVGETRDLLVTGTFNKSGENEVTELPNFPDITAMQIVIDGRRFSLETGTVEAYSRVLNLRTGELTREVTWISPEGKKISFCFERVVSLEREHVIAARLTMKSDSSFELKLESGINGRVTNTGSQHCLEGERRMYGGKCLEMIGKTNQSGVTYALHTVHRIEKNGAEWKTDFLPVIDRRYISCRYIGHVQAGETVVLEKISAIHTSRDLRYDGLGEEETLVRLKKESKEECMEAADLGYETIAGESAAAWEKFWNRADIIVDTERAFDQLAVRFASYHLNIMMKKDDSRVGIGAKGMTGEGYKGHSFWDTEIFIFPYFLMTNPKAARTLLEYRYKNLYGARKKAAEYGMDGAMYPWESAWIDDGEVTPLWGTADVVTGETLPILTGIIEVHISADIAYAVDQYYKATGDEDFMDRYGYEIILDTARFWLSKLTWIEERGRYEILDVIGPDEYKEHVDNNAYTNYMARHNISLAKQALSLLRKDKREIYARLEEPLQLEKLEKDLEKADRMYLPQPNEEGIIPQFDGYFDLKSIDLTKYKNSSIVGTIYNDYNMEQINSFQVAKQGDTVVLLELLEQEFEPDIRRKNFVYYEERTLHDSSLSKSTHCVLAADLGMEDMAYRFYEGAAGVDLGQEMKSSDMGVHTASMGGIWQAVVYGFGGVRLEEECLRIEPKLPADWKGLEFSLCYQGADLHVKADKGQVTVSCRGGNVKLKVCQKAVLLRDGDTQTWEY